MIIVTVPLGVLKRPAEEGGMSFTPPLSASKRAAIDSLGMGVENKVALRWEVPDVFWPAGEPYLQCTDERFRFLNGHYFGKKGVLVVMIAPPYAEQMEALSDEAVLGVVLPLVHTTFAPQLLTLPPPVEQHITRWASDPYSFGAYSYHQLGCDPSSGHAELRAPECPDGSPIPRLFFAGEACSPDATQCVHGAVVTGYEAAAEALRSLTLEHCAHRSPILTEICQRGGVLQCRCRAVYDPRRETVECVGCGEAYHAECLDADGEMGLTVAAAGSTTDGGDSSIRSGSSFSSGGGGGEDDAAGERPPFYCPACREQRGSA